MLNTVLTVGRTSPGSHKNKGWEKFTDAVIRSSAPRRADGVRAVGGLRQEEGDG
jgi:uracil-DNA glycosylase